MGEDTVELKKSQTAVQAEIVKQSAKAVQVKVEQGTFWFPKKNVTFNEEGQVVGVSTKMLAAKVEEAAEYKTIKKENDDWKQNGWACAPKSRITAETEKAVQVKFEGWISSARTYGDIDVKMWFPKSLCQITENQIMIKAWAWLRAAADKREYFEAREFDVHAIDENGNMVRG